MMCVMAKKITHDLTYDATLDEVAAMLADRSFREEVCKAQRVTEVDVTIDVDADTKDVTIDQWQPTAGMPSFAKKIVGEKTNIVQTEHWSSRSEADLTVVIPGKPGDMNGTIRLVEKDGKTTETVDLTVKVGIPLVGGKLEGLISDLLLSALRAENKVGRSYLSR